MRGYSGTENVAVTDEVSQAGIYGRLVRAAACAPHVAEVNFFGFYDAVERDEGFQSALYRVEGTPRASAATVRAAIADTAAGCRAAAAPWYPAKRVIGARRADLGPQGTAGDPVRGSGGRGC